MVWLAVVEAGGSIKQNEIESTNDGLPQRRNQTNVTP